jgi:hypothetical protein
MKYIIIHQVGSAYWLEGDTLCTAPISRDGTFDTDESAIVEEEMMRDEELLEPYYSATTFRQLYERVRHELKN